MPKPSLTIGHYITLVIFAAGFFIGWGTLHARVTAVEKQTDGLVPAIVDLKVEVAKLTTAMELRHKEGG